MEQEKIRLWKISKKILGFLGTLLLLFLMCKFAVYFMPFFIAGVLALITEPIIKFNMNKLKMSRRVSSTIVVTFTVILILAVATWLAFYAVGKVVDISKNIPSILGSTTNTIEGGFSNVFDELNEYVSEDTVDAMSDSLSSGIKSLSNYIQNIVSQLLLMIMSVPKLIINIIITILAFVLFTKDRLNIINIINFHFPEKWIKKTIMVKNEIFSTLSSYLKVYSKIIVITAVELIICFGFLNAIGFKFDHIIRLSILIAIIDILPVLGIGTVLIPWFVWSFITGNIGLGFALMIIYILLTIIRQTIEPKLVSKQLGIHPLITLLSMYAGFKIVGFSGLILGPFALMVLRCVYAEQIKKGLFKSLVEE